MHQVKIREKSPNLYNNLLLLITYIYFQEALHLCIAIIDDYTSKVQIRKDKFQLIGVTALLLASKQLIYDAPEISTLLSLCEVC